MTTRIMRKIWVTALFIIWVTLPQARALDPELPYAVRDLDYTAWSSSVRGDLRTIGMAGALVGLGDSWAGAIYNPAGLAMTLGYTGAQLNTNQIRDGQVQPKDQEIRVSNFGGFASTYPWGFAVGYWSPHKVGARYDLLGRQTKINNEISVDEFRVSLARTLLDNKLALGLGFILGRGRAELGFPGANIASVSESATAISGTVGVQYQHTNRIIFGLSYSLPVTYRLMGASTNTLGLPGFFQDLKSPSRLGLGLGWIPNRNFRLGVSLLRISGNENVALFSDQARLIGESATYQPSVGFEYHWADFPKFQGKVGLGSYLEAGRLRGIGPRQHWTGFFEANPWILNFGFAFDRGPQYRNILFSLGVDVLRTMRWMDLVPQESPREFQRWLPNPFAYSDGGLPRTLVKEWDGSGSTPGEILDIGKQIPKRLEKKVKATIESFGEMMNGKQREKSKKKKSDRKKDKAKKVSPKKSTNK